MSEQWSTDPVTADTVWGGDDDLLEVDERSSSHPPEGLITLRYLWDAVKRHASIWLLLALVGLAGGIAVPYVVPPENQASARLLLTHRDGDSPADAMATDVNLVSSNSVAQRTIERLGLSVTPDELLNRYSATPSTDRVLQIVASAPSAGEATRLADTLAEVYLEFRSEQFALQLVPLRRDLAAARTAITNARADVVAAGLDPNDQSLPVTAQTTRLAHAKETERFIAQQILDQEVIAAKISSSRVLDTATAVPRSERIGQALNAGAGLFAGLFIGIAFVVVRALVSDRLWRRQDVARALGTSVRLSVGRVPRLRWWRRPRRVRASATRSRNVRHVVDYLRDRADWTEAPKPALAVVSVDDLDVCAPIVAALAMSLAADDKRVLVADLSGRGVLAATLGVTSTGTCESRAGTDAGRIVVHLPDPDAAPAQGLQRPGAESGSGADNRLDTAWAEADVVVTLTTLSPALGADHLRTWASTAVALVAAGGSSMTTIATTGELVRLAGLRLHSAVVVRADRTDETIGVVDEVPERAAEDLGTPRVGVEMIGR